MYHSYQSRALSRRQMLKMSGAAALGLPIGAGLRPASAPRCAEHLILFWCAGGMSQFETWDPKPGRPAQGAFGAIATAADGVQISALFPRVARQMPHAAIIRSMSGHSGAHRPAAYELQTGHALTAKRPHPSIGSVIARERGPLGAQPAFVLIGGGEHPGHPPHPHGPRMMEVPRGLGLSRYGDSDFGRNARHALRLVEAGVRVVQVNRGGFDTHAEHFDSMRAHAAVMDPALAALLEDLTASGKLSETLVLVLSEFGRTPRINGRAGRDHHAKCFSCLIAGGGVRGGQVIGASDADGIFPAERPVTIPELHATIHHAMGITPRTPPGTQAVTELFG